LLSLSSPLVKIVIVDTNSGGGAFIFQARSHDIAQSIQSSVPKQTNELYAFLELLEAYQEKCYIEFLWDASSKEERLWIDALSCEYVIDVRKLGDEIAQMLALYALRGA